MKVRMIIPGLAPSVRSMAISADLSLTTITNVDTKLKAATATIKSNITNKIVFSIFNAWKKAPNVCVQFVT